ncbi:MAG: Asp-tRNA(Asn)/Glu-tRNA(Gln) amidotransferase GatCAB subunit B, partial [Planctomycetota bacterium]
ADVVGAMEIAAVGEDELRALCRELLVSNPKIVADVQGGKEQAAAGLIGQARKKNANVNPGEVRAMCLELIRAMGP